MPEFEEYVYEKLKRIFTKDRIMEIHSMIPDFGLQEPRELNDESKLNIMMLDADYLISTKAHPINIAAYIVKSIVTPIQLFKSGNHRTATVILKLIYDAADLILDCDEESMMGFMNGAPNWSENYLREWLTEHTQKS